MFGSTAVIAGAAVRAGVRSNGFRTVLILAFLLIVLAYLAALFSPRQPKTVALDVGFSGMRFALVLFVLLWVHELVGREFDRKTVYFWLTQPVSRARYLVGRYCGVLVLLAAAAAILGAALWLVVAVTAVDYQASRPVDTGAAYLAALSALWLEVAVVGAFAVLLTSVASSAMLPLAVGAAFAVIGRSIGPVVDYLLVRGADGNQQLAATYAPLIEAIRWILPDLSRLDWREWPMYALPPSAAELGWSLLMGVSYGLLCLVLAVIAMSRREFG